MVQNYLKEAHGEKWREGGDNIPYFDGNCKIQ